MARKKIINPTSRTRTVELDGKQYTIEFNFLAYDAFERATGISLIDAWEPSKFGAGHIATFIAAGLITHHPEIEQPAEFCHKALRGDNFSDVYGAALEAYTASLPKPKDDANPQKPIAK